MAKKTPDGELPTTAYAVLGLVSSCETSGYDLKRLADQSIGYFFWSPASSQIYAELRRLTALGYVREREVEQERRPDKRLYSITVDGERALRRWLERPEVAPDVHKSLLLLKLFFGKATPPSTLIAQLEEGRRQILKNLADFEEIERRIADSEEHFFAYMTLKSGIVHTHAALRWVDDTIEELKDRSSMEPQTE
jgi:DNA-binding PadR family transcriptional regulator